MTEQTGIDQEGAAKFHEQARALAFSEGVIPYLNESVKSWKDKVYLAAFAEWPYSLKNFGDVDEAIYNWVDWLQVAEKIVPDGENMETLTISRSHNLGAVTITLGVTREFPVRSAVHREALYEYMDRSLDVQLDNWLRANAAKAGAASMPQHVPESAGGSDYITEPAIELLHEFSGGKHLYKVKTPRFTKWGVPLYPEVLPSFGYSEDNPPPMGSTALDGWKVEILMDGDKPKKITSATKPE